MTESRNSGRNLRFSVDSVLATKIGYGFFPGPDMSEAVEEGRYYAQIYPVSINGQCNLSWYAIGAGNFALTLD